MNNTPFDYTHVPAQLVLDNAHRAEPHPSVTGLTGVEPLSDAIMHSNSDMNLLLGFWDLERRDLKRTPLEGAPQLLGEHTVHFVPLNSKLARMTVIGLELMRVAPVQNLYAVNRY